MTSVKMLLLGILSSFALNSLADVKAPAAGAKPTLTFAGYDSHAYFNASFSRGGYVLGAAYEVANKSSIGVGVFGHIYKKDNSKGATGNDLIGIFVAPHLDHGGWDCYFVTGLSYQKISSKTKDETGFGPSFGVGVLYHVKEGLALGMEKIDHYDWISENFKGLTMSDLVFKARFSF